LRPIDATPKGRAPFRAGGKKEPEIDENRETESRVELKLWAV
jgi:hypothetical protein